MVDVSGAPEDVRVGNELAFSLNYSALLAAMTSGYVTKKLVEEDASQGKV